MPSFLSLPVEFGGGSLDGGGEGRFCFGGGSFCPDEELDELFCDMEDQTNIDSVNNSKLIYEHTEKSIEKINKSIDIVTSKLTSSLGFSGVLLKFASDMPSKGGLFSLKVCVTVFLLGAVGFCACGLYPKAGGHSLTSRYLREELYYCPEDEIRLQIIDQRLKSIDSLEDLAKSRRSYLNFAVLSLMLAVTFFGVSIIVEAIPG